MPGECSRCGSSDLAEADGIRTCRGCGSIAVLAPTAKAHATVPTPSVGVFWSWTGAGLTLAAVIYGALITALGVVLAPLGGVWRIGYAVVALALLVLGLFIFRDQTIRAMRRYLDWRGRGRVV